MKNTHGQSMWRESGEESLRIVGSEYQKGVDIVNYDFCSMLSE
jgi:hypothetical protein